MTPTRTPETPSAKELQNIYSDVTGWGDDFLSACEAIYEYRSRIAAAILIAAAAIEEGWTVEAGVVTKPCESCDGTGELTCDYDDGHGPQTFTCPEDCRGGRIPAGKTKEGT